MRVRHALSLPIMLQRSLVRALQHDCLNLAQSAAYSAIVALFPALIVAAAAIAMVPDAVPLKQNVGELLDGVLPSNVFPLLTTYFAGDSKPHTLRALLLAALVSVSGASSVIATLMEGLRRAANQTEDHSTFWQRRLRALLLVPLSLVPLGIATMLVMFGQLVTDLIAASLSTFTRPAFYFAALLVRWAVALSGVAGVTSLIYHVGLPRRQSWWRTLPGAVAATVLWFLTTLAFGWYVTRFANYAQVYGSLGAGIALLFWLYIIFLSVLCGAEFNKLFFERYFAG